MYALLSASTRLNQRNSRSLARKVNEVVLTAAEPGLFRP